MPLTVFDFLVRLRRMMLCTVAIFFVSQKNGGFQIAILFVYQRVGGETSNILFFLILSWGRFSF